MSSKPSAIILGGTGAVGKTLVREALASNAFSRVLTLGRRPAPTEKLTVNTNLLVQRTVDFERLEDTVPKEEDLQPTAPPTSVVLSALGCTQPAKKSTDEFRRIDQTYVVDMAKLIHARSPNKDPQTGQSPIHFLHVSSVGVDDKSMFSYVRIKGETEKMLGHVGFKRVSIFQPAFLKVEEPRESGEALSERLFRVLVIPVAGRLFERKIAIDVGKVGRAMQVVAMSDTPEIGHVKPRVQVFEGSKTVVAWYSNEQMHDLATM